MACGDPPADRYECKACKADKKQERRGCKEDLKRKNPLWKIEDFCPCGGEDKNCETCNGSNHIPVYRCPRALAGSETGLLPFFFTYRLSNYSAWPDGRGRLFQPVKLILAFEQIEKYLNRKNHGAQT